MVVPVCFDWREKRSSVGRGSFFVVIVIHCFVCGMNSLSLNEKLCSGRGPITCDHVTCRSQGDSDVGHFEPGLTVKKKIG